MNLIQFEGLEIEADLLKIQKILQSDLKNKEELLQTYFEQIQIFIDENINKLSKEDSYKVMEFLYTLQQTPIVRIIFSDYFMCYHLNNNLAYLQQQLWSQNEEIVQKFVYLKKAIKITKQKIFETDSCNFEGLLYKMKYTYSLINNYLQLGACYSQLGDHIYSLNLGKKCLKQYKNMCKLILTFQECQEAKKSVKGLIKNMKSFMEKALQVSEFVLTKLELNCFMGEKSFEHFSQLNFKDLFEKFNISWASNMSIAYFMHIQYVSLKKVTHQLQDKEIFSETFFCLFVLLFSSLLFMISTENRLICMDEYFQINSQKKYKIKTIFEQNHFERIKKEKKFIFSKLVHQKCINMLQSYFVESSLLSHFQSSFEKNYSEKQELNLISEEASQKTLQQQSSKRFSVSSDESTKHKSQEVQKRSKSTFAIQQSSTKKFFEKQQKTQKKLLYKVNQFCQSQRKNKKNEQKLIKNKLKQKKNKEQKIQRKMRNKMDFHTQSEISKNIKKKIQPPFYNEQKSKEKFFEALFSNKQFLVQIFYPNKCKL